MSMWMVRAERGGVLFEDFMTNGHVTISGRIDVGDAQSISGRHGPDHRRAGAPS